MKKSAKVLACISGLLLTAVLAIAADLSGKITVRGSPIAGAVVTANLIGAKGAAAVTVTRTDTQGAYALRGLSNGNYILFVDLSGKRIYQGKIAIAGATSVKNIDLK
jgi:redox-regulated HSP33 family molecular chaperone